MKISFFMFIYFEISVGYAWLLYDQRLEYTKFETTKTILPANQPKILETIKSHTGRVR